MARRLFWVLYDYGHGGLWAIIAANSAAQIRAIYPRLQIFDIPPPTLDESTRERIVAEGPQDIADPPAGWLKDLAQPGDPGEHLSATDWREPWPCKSSMDNPNAKRLADLPAWLHIRSPAQLQDVLALVSRRTVTGHHRC